MSGRIRGAVSWGLLGTLVLIAVVEWRLARNDVHLAGIGPLCWRGSRCATRQALRSEILCFGTSLSKSGLLPRVIERRTGRSAYNLAVFSGPMASSYFLLRRALEAGARPVAVVIDAQDGPIDRDRRRERPEALTSNWRTWPELLDLRDCLDLSWSARDAGFFTAIILAKKLPSYRSRFEIRSSILAAFQGRSDSTWPETVWFQRNLTINQGAFVLARNPQSQARRREDATLAASSRPGMRRGIRWARNKLSASYTRRFLDLAATHGVTVFWLLPPLSPEVQAQRERSGVDDYLTRCAQKAQSHSCPVIVLDGRHSGYDWRVFSDNSHLDRHGATTLSTDVAAAIRHSFAHPSAVPRWVVLPAYRDLATDFPAEDLAQSQAALIQQARRR